MPKYLYITGLGENLHPIRRLLLISWRLRGKRYELIEMRWNDERETYQQKQQRILSRINAEKKQPVILVGESAGGAMALSMLANFSHKIDQVITICGYNHTASKINDPHRALHPALVQVVEFNDRHMNDIVRNSDKITNIYSLADGTIDQKYSKVGGAKHIEITTPNHQLSIVRSILNFFKLIRS